MRTIELGLARLRLGARRLRARTGPTDPAHVQPARLVLDLSSPASAADLALPALRDLLVEAIQWLGPVPVAVQVGNRGDHPLAPELLRFAHRLGCTTRLETTGTGLGPGRARLLVDHGLDAVRLFVAGIDDGTQQAVLGTDAAAPTGALAALVEARRRRGAAVDLEVAVPWEAGVDTGLAALVGWARQLGADGLRVVAPHDPRRLPAHGAALGGLPRDGFDRTGPRIHAALRALHRVQDEGPGLPRAQAPRPWRLLPCPVGGQRLVVDATGLLLACPHHPPVGHLAGGLRRTWETAGPHLAAIHGCTRRCAHVELAPAPALAATLATGAGAE